MDDEKDWDPRYKGDPDLGALLGFLIIMFVFFLWGLS